LLSPGTYDLLFTASGYNSKLIEGVVVGEREQTWLNVIMKSSGQSVEEIDQERVKIWPVPAEREIIIQMPEGFLGKSQISIFSNNGTLLLIAEKDIYSNEPLEIDVSQLPGGFYICRVISINSSRSITGRFIKR
jgi:hypothetical protein